MYKNLEITSLKEEIEELEENIESLEEEIEDYKQLTSCFLEVFRRSRQKQVTFFSILQEYSEDEEVFNKFIKMINGSEMHDNVKYIEELNEYKQWI